MDSFIGLTRRQALSAALFVATGLPVLLSTAGCDVQAQPVQTKAPSNSVEPDEETARANELIERSRVEHEEAIVSYIQIVEIGVTAALANKDVEVASTNPSTGEEMTIKLPDYVWWDGTIEATVNAVNVYESVQQAAEAEKLGLIVRKVPPYEQGAFLLVVHMTLTNVNALSRRGDGLFDTDAFCPLYSMEGGDDSAVLYALPASFDGAVEGASTDERLANCFNLGVGETKSLIAGWWVDNACDISTLQIRPSLSATDQGPVIFRLGLSDIDETTA